MQAEAGRAAAFWSRGEGRERTREPAQGWELGLARGLGCDMSWLPFIDCSNAGDLERAGLGNGL